MTHRHPKQRIDQVWPKEQLKQPFESENEGAECAGQTLADQRADPNHGGVSEQRDDSDNPVQNSRPFKGT